MRIRRCSPVEVTAERLAELCAAYGFDGWLINIEADVPPALLPALIEFCSLDTLLQNATRRARTRAVLRLVGCIDGEGFVSERTDASEHAFLRRVRRHFHQLLVDAAALKASLVTRDARKYDVYAGVDCFARAPHPRFTMPYTSGTGCVRGQPCRRSWSSLALFAPGWSLECGEAKGKSGADAARCDAMFWAALNIDRLRSAFALGTLVRAVPIRTDSARVFPSSRLTRATDGTLGGGPARAST